MKITQALLRRIIREALLTEAAMTPADARNRSIRFEMSRSRAKVKITAFKEDEEDIEVGYIAADLIPHESTRVWGSSYPVPTSAGWVRCSMTSCSMPSPLIP